MAIDLTIQDGDGSIDVTVTGGASEPTALDLGDDGSNESGALAEIATQNDSNNIFTEPSADKLLIDVGLNWPTADSVADGTGIWTRADITTNTTLSAWDSAWVNTSAVGGPALETLPADANVDDGDRVEIGIEDATHHTNVTANTGQSILGQTGNMTAAGSTRTYEYKSSSSTWMVR